MRFSTSNLKKSIFIFLLSLFISTSAVSQDIFKQISGSTEDQSQLISHNQESIQKRKAEIAKRIDAIDEVLSQNGETESIAKERELLLQLSLHLEDLSNLLNEVGVLKTEESGASKKLEDPKDFGELERYKDQLIRYNQEAKYADTKIDNIRSLLIEAKDYFESQEKKKRLAKSKDKTSDNLSLEKEIASVVLEVRRAELEKELIRKSTVEKKREAYSKKVSSWSERSIFSEKYLSEQLESIDLEVLKSKKAQDKARNDLQAATRAYRNYVNSVSDELEKNSNNLEFSVLRLLNSAAQLKLRMRVDQTRYLSEAKSLWSTRYEILTKKHSQPEIQSQYGEAAKNIERLRREKELTFAEVDKLRKLAFNNLELAAAEQGSPRLLRMQEKGMTSLTSAFEDYAKRFDSLILLNEKIQLESDSFLNKLSFGAFVDYANSYISQIWNYELFSSDDYPVTVNKLLLALFLIALGFFVSRIISKRLVLRMSKRFKLTEGASAAVQSLVFYLLFLCFALFGLRVANVPLTVFTVLGGALAIGVGFGSQNVMNNFISGLILLTEQPVRVGDMIQIEDFTGTVRKIGGRSTIVRTADNIEIIVPNSSFLEKKVINWTRNNTTVRLKVIVGVIYGSPTDVVTEILKTAAVEHKKVYESPNPFVWFKDFGDNALIFELHFWVSIRSSSERYQIESDIRYEIDAKCREKSIVIAFPQRDVHLDTVKPLEIRMVAGEG